jgi:type IV pilus assembly protein PilN
MRVTLNLATRPFADLGPAIKRLRITMAVLAVVAVGLLLGLHAIHRKAEAARARDHSLDGQIARIAQERQGYQNLMRQPDNANLLKQAAVLNKLFDEKAFSWTLAMEDLETVLPGGVQVTTLEPARAKDGHITLRLQVVGPRNRAVDLVRNLEHSRRFLLPRIVGENAQATERPGQRIEPASMADREAFDLLAEYNPATEQERKATRKPITKLEDLEGAGTDAQRPIHPLPLPQAGQGRPPYAGQARPMNPASVNPGARHAVPSMPAPLPGPLNGRAPVPAAAPRPAPGGPQ